jgi:hypothetical protein
MGELDGSIEARAIPIESVISNSTRIHREAYGIGSGGLVTMVKEAYPRTVTGHEINECNAAIEIRADAENPDNGGASHHYMLKYPRAFLGFPVQDGYEMQRISFQDGPIKEVGTNGITHEALLAILIDRLESFQRGAYACPENAATIFYLRTALDMLHARTKLRDERGVEGTHEV